MQGLKVDYVISPGSLCFIPNSRKIIIQVEKIIHFTGHTILMLLKIFTTKNKNNNPLQSNILEALKEWIIIGSY